MDLEARITRLERAVWYERGRSEVLAKIASTLLFDLERSAPGAAAVILKRSGNVPDEITSGNPEIWASFEKGAEDALESFRADLKVD